MVDEHAHHHGTVRLDEGSGLNSMAASATLHCLTGCAIGEILGLMIGTAVGLPVGATIALAVALAFLFGYAVSTLPLLAAGLRLRAALAVVFAADTLSIATMEVVDNAVMALVPGAMEAGLARPIFWLSMALALSVAYVVAFPVNRALLARGKGHALTHAFHHEPGGAPPSRRVPTIATSTLAVAIGTFLLGGLVASLASSGEIEQPAPHSAPGRIGDTPRR